MTDPNTPTPGFLGRIMVLFQRNKRDPLDSGSATPEPELARFGSLRLTPRRLVQSYSWRQSTAPLSRVVRVDVQRVHTRTWLIIMIFCILAGWGAMQWTKVEGCMAVGLCGAGFAFIFYLVSRRTKLTVSLEDGSDMTVAVRNKHFVRASRFANIVCRVSTLWEPPRDRETNMLDVPKQGTSRAAIEIVDEYETTDEESNVDSSHNPDLATQITGDTENEAHPRITMPEVPDPDDEPTDNPIGVD